MHSPFFQDFFPFHYHGTYESETFKMLLHTCPQCSSKYSSQKYSFGSLKFWVTNFLQTIFGISAFTIVKHIGNQKCDYLKREPSIERNVLKFTPLGKYSMHTGPFSQLRSVWGHSVHFLFSTILYLEHAGRRAKQM